MDDFYGWLKHDELLRVFDRYPHRVPVKGGFVQFQAKKIYVTSNTEVYEWYKFEKFDPTALMRRINEYHVHGVEGFRPLAETPIYKPQYPINY